MEIINIKNLKENEILTGGVFITLPYSKKIIKFSTSNELASVYSFIEHYTFQNRSHYSYEEREILEGFTYFWDEEYWNMVDFEEDNGEGLKFSNIILQNRKLEEAKNSCSVIYFTLSGGCCKTNMNTLELITNLMSNIFSNDTNSEQFAIIGVCESSLNIIPLFHTELKKEIELWKTSLNDDVLSLYYFVPSAISTDECEKFHKLIDSFLNI